MVTFHRILIVIALAAALSATRVGAQPLIADVTTDRARYAPGAPVRVEVRLSNGSGARTVSGTITLRCAHLADAVPGPTPQRFRLAPDAKQTVTFAWRPPAKDYQGNSVEAVARDGAGKTLDRAYTAVDVSSSWLKFPRYGYLASYARQPAKASEDAIRQLNAYHINGLQFYDWQYKHHKPLAEDNGKPADSWLELAASAGHPKTNYRQTVLDLIGAAHGRGMAAMNYNLVYGAWPNYGRDGVDYRWGLWRDRGGKEQVSIALPTVWQADRIYLFDPGNAEWQRYLIGQERKVFAAYPFDGWHADQIGDSGQVYTHAGAPIDLKKGYASMVDRARAELGKPVISNNVGAYGLEESAGASAEDAAYVECWEWSGQASYYDLKHTLDRSATLSKGTKATILAAYMNKEYANKFADRVPGAFNLPGLLLTDATIFASGGSHIEMGDGDRMLCSEYFPNRNMALTDDAKRSLRRYYDFLTAYENLLRDGQRDIVNGVALDRPSSGIGAANAVWSFARAGKSHHVLHLINLTGSASTAWRDDKGDRPTPTLQKDIAVKYYVGAFRVKRICWATPDQTDLGMTPVKFTEGNDGNGRYVQFTLPSLAYWDMVYIAGD